MWFFSAIVSIYGLLGQFIIIRCSKHCDGCQSAISCIGKHRDGRQSVISYIKKHHNGCHDASSFLYEVFFGQTN